MTQRLLNRELSWLAFNRRVLSLAAEPGIPLLERLKFAAICSSNLDEFFQVRVAALKDQVAAGVGRLSPDGMTAQAQLTAIGRAADRFVADQERIVLDDLLPSLAEAGIRIVHWAELEEVDRAHLVEFFESRVFPVLTPLAVDPAHPFPYISNLSLNLAAMVTDPDVGERRFARVKIPNVFPRLVVLADGQRFVPVEEIIAAQLHQLFVGMVVEEHAFFRVTRNADLTLEEEEADDLLAAVEMELRRRRFGRAVRLEAQQGISMEMLELLVRELDLEADDVTLHRGPLDITCCFQLHALDRPDLKDPPWTPVTAGRIMRAESQDRSIFSVIRERALMVHHPYESFAGSVENFLAQAADDPQVKSIKMTLYRAGGDSPIIRSLMRAAERGVQVAVLVELKARFDEATNVGWAKALERSGVHVVYGLVGLKTHAKCTLVVREDDDGLRRYCHIATGNYNSKTARTYEDVGFLTCDPKVGSDVTQLFNHLQPGGRIPVTAGGAARPAHPAGGPDRARDVVRPGGQDHRQAQLVDGPGDDRGAVPGQPGRRADPADHQGHLLPAARCARPQRDGAGAQHPRPLPGAFTDHPFRARRRGSTPVRHRQRGLDGPQPGPPGRGDGAGGAPEAPRLAGPGAGVRPGGRHRPPRAGQRGRVAPSRPRRLLPR